MLHFIITNTNPVDPADKVDGRDLVVEGLKTEDVQLARTAAFAASYLISDGVDLGPDIRIILKDHGERFSEVGSSASSALYELDVRDQNSSREPRSGA